MDRVKSPPRDIARRPSPSPSPNVEGQRGGTDSGDLDLRGLEDMLQGATKHAISSPLDGPPRRERQYIILDADDDITEEGGGEQRDGMTRVTNREFMLSSQDDFMMADILDQTMREHGTLIIGSIPPASQKEASSTRNQAPAREVNTVTQDIPALNGKPGASQQQVSVVLVSPPKAIERSLNTQNLLDGNVSSQIPRTVGETTQLSSSVDPAPEPPAQLTPHDHINIPVSTPPPTQPPVRSVSQPPPLTPPEQANIRSLSTSRPATSHQTPTWKTLSQGAAKAAYLKRLGFSSFSIIKDRAAQRTNARAAAARRPILPKNVDKRPEQVVSVGERELGVMNGKGDSHRGEEIASLEAAEREARGPGNTSPMETEGMSVDSTKSLGQQSQVTPLPQSSLLLALNDNTTSSPKESSSLETPSQTSFQHESSLGEERLSITAEELESSSNKHQKENEDTTSVSVGEEDGMLAEIVEATIPMNGVEKVADDFTLMPGAEMDRETISEGHGSVVLKESVLSDVPADEIVPPVATLDDRGERTEDVTIVAEDAIVESQIMQIDTTRNPSPDRTDTAGGIVAAAEDTVSTAEFKMMESDETATVETVQSMSSIPIGPSSSDNIDEPTETEQAPQPSSSAVVSGSGTTYWHAPIPAAPLPSPRLPSAWIESSPIPAVRPVTRRESATPFPTAPIPPPPTIRSTAVEPEPIPSATVSIPGQSASPPLTTVETPSHIPSNPTPLNTAPIPTSSPPTIIEVQTPTTPSVPANNAPSPAQLPSERKRSVSVVIPVTSQPPSPDSTPSSDPPSPSRPMKIKIKFNETTTSQPVGKRRRISRSKSQSVQPRLSNPPAEREMLDCIVVRMDFENVRSSGPFHDLSCETLTGRLRRMVVWEK